jgi:hypothetical protein
MYISIAKDNATNTPPVFPISAAKMLEVEGVYQMEGNSETVHIVLKGNRTNAVLVFSPINKTLVPSSISATSPSKFRQLKKYVIFGVKD